MRLLHCSDLHIGKRVNGFSMLEDQRHILAQILAVAAREAADAILIAGDIYDKTIPSAEAVELFDWFLTRLTEQGKPVFFLSGNHDSPERLDYASRILQNQQVYIAGSYHGTALTHTLSDEYGPVHVHLVPFLKPGIVNGALQTHCESYQEAMEEVLRELPVRPDERNILVAHQFITAGGVSPEQSDSELISLGGVDQIDVSVFDGFDYVALGHIHGPQRIGRDTVRYSGSPLKYSFSECRHQKSVCLVELREKGIVSVRLIPMHPLLDMRKIRGRLEELLSEEVAALADRNDYLHVTLTDEDTILDAIGKLRRIYPNVMQLEFENKRSQDSEEYGFFTQEAVEERSMDSLFSEFYQNQNNRPMDEAQKQFLEQCIRQIGEVER